MGEIICSRENNLVILNCKEADGWRRVCLVGLAHIKITRGETTGRIFVISGDPLIPHEPVGERFPNKVALDRIPLTGDQRKKIFESSLVRDGFCYLYAADFYLEKFPTPKECVSWKKLNVLLFLADYMMKHILMFNMSKVVTMTVEQLGTNKMAKGGSGNAQVEKVPEKVDGNAKLLFRTTSKQVLVELECPANHRGYRIELCFIQLIMSRCKVTGSWGNQKNSQILDKVTIVVTPNSLGHEYAGRNRINIPIKAFKYPVDEKTTVLPFLKKFWECRVEYWMKSRLTPAKMQDFMNPGTSQDPKGKRGTSGAPTRRRRNSVKSRFRYLSDYSSESLSEDKFVRESNLVKLVFMEMELVDGEERQQ